MGKLADQSILEKARDYFEKGYRLQMSGHIKEAIQLYKMSLEVCPTPEAHTFLGWAYSHEGKYDLAIQECKRAIELDPEYGNPYNDIGAYLIHQGHFEEAEYWLRQAVEAPKYEARHFAHFNLGWVMERMGRWFDAIEEYKKAQEHDPQYTLATIAQLDLQARLN